MTEPRKCRTGAAPTRREHAEQDRLIEKAADQ